jgi:hypothetical protein
VFDALLEQPLFLLQRLMVTGFVMMFFQAADAIRRVTFGLMVTVTYMAMLLIFRPYKQTDLNMLAAIGSQFALLFLMQVALFMRIFNDIADRCDLDRAREIMRFNGPTEVRRKKGRAIISLQINNACLT